MESITQSRSFLAEVRQPFSHGRTHFMGILGIFYFGMGGLLRYQACNSNRPGERTQAWMASRRRTSSYPREFCNEASNDTMANNCRCLKLRDRLCRFEGSQC